MSALARRFPSPCRIPSHFTRIPYRHIRSHLYRSKIVYKSKGHRFESCPVHHKPPALRSVGGFSFCLVMLGNFPLRDLCGMGHGAGFLLCFHFFFFRSSGQFLQIVSHRPENAADQVPRRNNTMTGRSSARFAWTASGSRSASSARVSICSWTEKGHFSKR